jgi:chromosome segregation ATPase
MEPQVIYLIVGAFALLIGFAIGWFISKSRARIKFISGQAKFDSQTERIAELNAIINGLNAQIDLVRNESQTHANNATRFESGLSGANIRVVELQNELKDLHTKYEIIDREFSAAKEIHAGLKAKHDKHLLDAIEISNERAR